MLYYLFEFIEQKFQFPGATLFQFISFRASLAIILSLIFSLIFGRRIIEQLVHCQRIVSWTVVSSRRCKLCCCADSCFTNDLSSAKPKRGGSRFLYVIQISFAKKKKSADDATAAYFHRPL